MIHEDLVEVHEVEVQPSGEIVEEIQQGSPRLKSKGPAVDLSKFFEILDVIIKSQLELEGSSCKLILSEDYPDEDDNLDEERIVFSVKSRHPMMLSRGTPDRAVSARPVDRERRPRFREHIRDPDNPGMFIVNHSQRFDNEICFEILAKKNKTANKRVLWFEDLINNWRWYFESLGLQRIEFLERKEDTVITPGKTKIACRPLFYLVRTERIFQSKESELRSMQMRSSLERGSR